MVGVTNHCKLAALNNRKLSYYCCVGQKSKMNLMWLKSGCWQGRAASGGSRGEYVPFLLPTSRAEFLVSWSLPLSSKPVMEHLFSDSASLCFHHMAVFSFICGRVSCSPLTRILVILFRVQPDNPG